MVKLPNERSDENKLFAQRIGSIGDWYAVILAALCGKEFFFFNIILDDGNSRRGYLFFIERRFREKR